MSFHRLAYRALTASLSPFLPLWLKRRARAGKEDTARLSERCSKASRPRPNGQLFWLHGASVGETVMLLPVIDALLEAYPEAHILLTSGTVTSARLMAERLSPRALHQYAPLDTRQNVAWFLDHWQPDLAIWAESEIWPNLVLDTKARGVPMALLNARMSAKSLAGWAKRKRFAAKIFNSFDYIQAADPQTAKTLSSLTGQTLPVFASLKDTAAPLPFDAREKSELQSAIGPRPVWCAASTHAGEDEIILRAHAEIRKAHPNALLLLAPRHPKRRADIQDLTDIPIMLHSAKAQLGSDTAVYMIDTIGDMGLAFSLSSAAMMCGSLRDDLLGHNPLEPARHHNAVLTGPHVDSFASLYEDMIAFGAAVPIMTDMEIAAHISELFSGPQKLAAQQAKAYTFAQSREAVLDQTMTALTTLIDGAAP